jgi:carboxypeptidase Taq
MQKQLKRLKEIEKELSLLSGVGALLFWDQRTLMPKNAVDYRGEQRAYLSKLVHEKRTSKELKEIIGYLSKPKIFKKLDNTNKKIVKKYKKEIKKWNKVPDEHVEEFSRLISKSSSVWEKAKKENNFEIFAPYLKKIVDMKIKEATLVDPKEKTYNVLLDNFEEGMTVEELDKIFSRLKEGILEILETIKKSKTYKKQGDIFSKKKFSIEKQKKTANDIKLKLFLSDKNTVLGKSMHPFTTKISPEDVRLTTNYNKREPLKSFSATIHEGGHALYELGFDEKLKYSILYGSPSHGMHESQSRFWENHIAKSNSFWDFYFPKYKREFNEKLRNVTKNQFFLRVNQVKPSFIRVEADEVTYCLHIIIRYEIERELLEGKIKVKDLPKEWNKRYKKYLGITPKTNTEGVLQDVHWSFGGFGYFPTYAIGTMYAAMLFKQLKKEKRGIEKQIAKGNFKPILDWLRVKVHHVSGRKLAEEIIEDVCGKKIDENDFLGYLREKYYKIYK